jgi:hypothetical protein
VLTSRERNRGLSGFLVVAARFRGSSRNGSMGTVAFSGAREFPDRKTFRYGAVVGLH